MKHLLLLCIGFFMILSCTDESQNISHIVNVDDILDKGIKNLSDIDDLVNSKTYPFDKLSEKAILDFKSTITFSEGNLKTYNASSLAAELTKEELIKVYTILAGSDIFIERGEKFELPDLESRSSTCYIFTVLQATPSFCDPCEKWDCCKEEGDMYDNCSTVVCFPEPGCGGPSDG